MKVINSLVAGGLALWSAYATADLSANLALTNDYVFRGISQSDEDFALQGGADASMALPFATSQDIYIGTWASNVDFDGDSMIEYDIYFGLRGPAFGIRYDWGVIFYNYTEEQDYNYVETYLTLGKDLGFADISGSVFFTPDYYNSTGEAYYWSGDVDIPLPWWGLTLKTHAGYQTLSDEPRFFFGKGARFMNPVPEPEDDYIDYKVALWKDFGAVEVEAAWTGTNLSGNSDCGDLCTLASDRFVATVSRTFDF